MPRKPSLLADRPTDPLADYNAKRDFRKSPEPKGELGQGVSELVFVVQKHAATRLHYDFRLELDGVMLSWAVPKGPSFDPKEKRMAVRTEDHPISYNSFEGVIPKGQYGAGRVLIWDRGRWQPVGDPHDGLRDGKLLFQLFGHKLSGAWELVRIGKPGDRQMAWILFKKHDQYARASADYDVISALPDSVADKPMPQASKPARATLPAPPSHARQLPGAVAAALPARLGPQLATLSSGMPQSGDWSFEIKFDGYRLMTRLDEHGKPHLITRNGHDWSHKMPALAAELAALKLTSSWLDGEIVVLGANGMPEFNALQNALDKAGSASISYFLFDVPFFDGHDLRRVALRERRAFLQAWLAKQGRAKLRFSADFEADAQTMLQSAQKLGLEGVIAKRGDAPYVSARTETWLKLKCRQRQEFVVLGFTDRGNDPSSAEIGSLLLGVYESPKKLVAVGGLGTGWSARVAAELKAQLVKIERPKPPAALAELPQPGRWTRREIDAIRWVKPTLVVEATFADWTPEGQVRHATFVGLREDKPALEIRRETAATPAGVVPLRASQATKVTHPERVIDADSGLTKLDLVRYYEGVAPRLLRHLAGRPCSLVRGPDGVGGQLFFQKHDDKLSIPGLRQLDAALWPGHEAMIEVPSERAIAEAAQMNVIEFHTWNANVKAIDKPDRMLFDLDPGDGVPWKQVQEAALLVRSLLSDLELQCWLKTSGGKGLHVVVPLAPRHGWDLVKDFSQAVVQQLARVIPSRFVAVSGPKNRVGRIFVDYLRNSHGATTAAAFSVRARPGLGVSMPVSWDELAALKGGAHWTVASAREHLSFERQDPWADYWSSRQTLTRASKRLGLTTTRQ